MNATDRITPGQSITAGQRNRADAIVRDWLDQGIEPESLVDRWLLVPLTFGISLPTVLDDVRSVVWRGTGVIRDVLANFLRGGPGATWGGDVEVSRDGGTTWNTIFAVGSELTGLPASTTTATRRTTAAGQIPYERAVLGDGYILRLNSDVDPAPPGAQEVVVVTVWVATPMGGASG